MILSVFWQSENHTNTATLLILFTALFNDFLAFHYALRQVALALQSESYPPPQMSSLF